MKGFVVFYVNFPTLGQDALDTLKLIKSQSTEMIEKCNADGYDVMWMPTQNEASRVDKVDYESPQGSFKRDVFKKKED